MLTFEQILLLPPAVTSAIYESTDLSQAAELLNLGEKELDETLKQTLGNDYHYAELKAEITTLLMNVSEINYQKKEASITKKNHIAIIKTAPKTEIFIADQIGAMFHLNGLAVEPNEKIIKKTTNGGCKYYILQFDTAKHPTEEVTTRRKLGKKRLKHLDGSPVAATEKLETITRGKKTEYYSIKRGDDGKVQKQKVFPHAVLENKHLRHLNGHSVSREEEIISEKVGKKIKYYSVMRDENKKIISQEEVITTQSFFNNRLKHLNGNKVTPDEEIIQKTVGNETKYFSLQRDKNKNIINEEEVFIPKTHNVHLRHLNGTHLKKNAEVITETTDGNTHYYVVTRDAANQIIGKEEVFSAKVFFDSTLRHINGKFVTDDETIQIETHGEITKYYVVTTLNDNPYKEEVYPNRKFYNNRLKHADGSFVTEQEKVIREKNNGSDIYYVLRSDENGNTNKERVYTLIQFKNKEKDLKITTENKNTWQSIKVDSPLYGGMFYNNKMLPDATEKPSSSFTKSREDYMQKK